MIHKKFCRIPMQMRISISENWHSGGDIALDSGLVGGEALMTSNPFGVMAPPWLVQCCLLQPTDRKLFSNTCIWHTLVPDPSRA